MICLSDFKSVLARLPCYLLKGPLKGDFLDIYLNTFFGVPKLKNTSRMRVITFLKIFKTESKFGKCKKKIKKNGENIFRFWDKCIWKCCYKLPLIRREFFSSAVNGLTNSPKILHRSERGFFNLSWLHRDQYIWYRCCHSVLNSVSAR